MLPRISLRGTSLFVFVVLVLVSAVTIFEPGAVRSAGSVTPTVVPTPTVTPYPTQVPQCRWDCRLMIWPVSGPISSYFGPAHPLGIDIDLQFAKDKGVKAPEYGVVTFAGGNPCCSYGNYIVINHQNGLETLYAHLSKLEVKIGEIVRLGQEIGIAGNTGYATGVHLHFEVHDGGKIVNPFDYLP